MFNKKKKNHTTTIVLGSIGFVMGLGAAFLFGTQKGEKYRNQIGEFSADFLDTVGDGFKEMKKSLLK